MLAGGFRRGVVADRAIRPMPIGGTGLGADPIAA
jgi:hypothetical protein